MDNELLFQVMSEKELDIQDRVINVLQRDNPELAEKTKKRISDVEDETRLKIAFVGQHNAGKSTIVSALTRNKDIKISSNVETDETASFEWNDVLLYDTPGLYAGVKSTHDESALEAIKSSDLLIFCITSSLFDDLMIESFIDLAYKRSYKNKILLVVNKMSQEDAPFEELRDNYTKTLSTTLSEMGGSLSDFPIVFIDAKDYKDGMDEDDEELKELSHFDSFISLLNEQIVSRGLLAKLDTKCNILLDAISEAIASTGTEFDKNMMVVLNRTARTIRHYKKDMRNELDRIELDFRSSILEIGNGLIDKIGVSKITDEDLNESNRKIEDKAEEYIGIIEEALSNKMAELDEEIEDDLSSEIGLYVFQDINTDEYKARSVYARDYTDFVEKYGSASKMLKTGGERVANMALAKGATDFTRLASSSGSAIHKTVLSVGHFFGAKFKPWQAVKIANGVGKVAKAAGPVLAVADVVITVATKVADEKKRKDIQKARESAFNSISSIASDIITEIDKQYARMEVEVFDNKLDDIKSIKEKMVMEAGENSKLVEQLRELSDELKSLMKNVSDINKLSAS